MIHPPEQLLSAFYDGQLPLPERDAIADHLIQCKACEALLRDFGNISHRIGSAAMPEPSVLAQSQWLRSFRPARERGVRQLAGLLTAAAAIVIVVSGAIPSSAKATPAPAEWETAAVTGSADVGNSPLATAQWIVADLSAGSGEAK